MVDSGATALFIDHSFVTLHRINTFPLRQSIRLLNIDGSDNSAGQLTHFARLRMRVDGFDQWTDFLVTNLGGDSVVLGLPWLRRFNPTIDWSRGTLHRRRSTVEDVTDSPDHPTAPEDLQNRGPTEPPSGDCLVEEVELPPCASGTPPPSSEPDDKSTSPPCSPSPDPPPSELEDDEDAPPPLMRLSASRRTRREWWHNGLLEDTTDTLWCASGFTVVEDTETAPPARTFEEMVPEHYRHHEKIFSESASKRLPEHQPWDHAIDLKLDAPTTFGTKVYPMSQSEQKELDAFLDDHLQRGTIRPSQSPTASPVFFVKKKGGALRLVQDYRRVNEFTVKSRYPLPLVSDIINRLRGSKYFTKFDARWGYMNVRLRNGDEPKAAFATNRGLFEPLVMFFGLTNSPATFQALMNSIFADLIAAGKVAVYLDDILIFTKTLEEHRKIVNEVLDRLAAHDLYLRPEKCEFEKLEIEYLGLVIREGNVGMDPAKVEAVRNWPTPRNLREVRSFLGFANFYRRFINSFARIARPLNDLTRKDTAWHWGDAEMRAFEGLRDAFVSAPVLVMWDPERPLRMETDASGFATGGVLLQQQPDGNWHPVAYRSASMLPAERNYEIYDREMLAIIEALKDWRHFLEGLEQPFEIVSDHSNLTYWRTAQDLSRRQARWALYLSRFDFRLVYRPGATNMADPLTRLPHHHISDADDNTAQVVLDPSRFATLAATSLVVRNPLEQRIRDASGREALVLAALDRLRRAGPSRLANGLPSTLR